MSQFVSTLIIVFGFILVSFFLINIRHIFTGKEFRGTCATNNPMLKSKMGECQVCGRQEGEECKMPEPGKAGA
ncbi:MAG: hypothetical protein R3301_10330 [Saprospiraceae bacterium]|nr:hypothetical protein [Saprospiraceae bacterium]